MLKQRIVTAAILLPLFVWALLTLPYSILSLLFALIVILGAWEWCRLIGVQTRAGQLAYLVTVFFAVGVVAWTLEDSDWSDFWLGLATLFWLLALAAVVRFQRQGHRQAAPMPRWQGGIVGILVLVPTWLGLMTLLTLDDRGRLLVLFLMVLIWSADSGAYFAGRRWGRRKLAAHVSPGKSWEGVAGGSALALLFTVAAAVYWYDGILMIVLFLLLALCTILISVTGDLYESVLKRQAGVKDSGTLLPGHGGVLDRIDSLTAAAPVFALGMSKLQGLAS